MGLYRSLPRLSPAQREWIASDVVGNRVFTAGKKCWCAKCGGGWEEKIDAGANEAVCPHCGARGGIHRGRNTTWKGMEYIQFLQVHRGWQVIKYMLIRWEARRGENIKIYDMDIIQKWCQPGRPMITLGTGLTFAPYWRSIPYSLWGSGLVIKYPSYFYTEWMECKAYPRMSLLPVYVKHLGKRPSFGEYTAPDLLGNIYGNPYLERLYKAGETKQLKELLDHVELVNRYWPSIRVAIRHGYTPEHWNDYFEHLRALKYLRYDMRSPKYVAPENFGELHDLVMRQYRNKLDAAEERRRQREELRQAMWREQQEQRRREGAKSFAKRIAKFAGLHLEDGDIVITPLMDITAFKDEGNAMHHCVFTNSYYTREDSLILSARMKDGGERVETVEVSLRQWAIVQSRGIYNSTTERHDEICSLVNGAMDSIRQMAAARTN